MAFAIVATWAGAALAEGLTLEDAVRLALSQNERAQKAPLRVAVAQAQLERARDAFLPALSVSASSSYHPDARAGSSVSNSAGLTLNQPLLNPGAFPQLAQQKHNLDAEKWGSEQDRRQLAFDAAKAFLQALTAENVLTSAGRKRDGAQLNLETSQARASAGLASSNDVTKAELQLATSEGQLESARGALRRTYLGLSFLIGSEVSGPLVPPDNTTHAAQEFEHARANQVRSALERRTQALSAAQNRRPDVLSLHERTTGLENAADEPLYRLIPSLSASGQVRANPDPLPNEAAFDEQVSLNLSWQVFDAGLRYADREQRLAQLQSSRLDEQLLRRSVQNEIELALATLRAARGNFRSALSAAGAAQKNAQETGVLYQQGLARAIEVSDANDKLFEAEVSRDAAKLNMEQAYLDLRNALGFGPLDQAQGARPE